MKDLKKEEYISINGGWDLKEYGCKVYNAIKGVATDIRDAIRDASSC